MFREEKTLLFELLFIDAKEWKGKARNKDNGNKNKILKLKLFLQLIKIYKTFWVLTFILENMLQILIGQGK